MQEKLEKLADGLARLREEEQKARVLGDRKAEAQLRRLRGWFETELMLKIGAEKGEGRRRVLELKYLDGLKPSQIIEILGIARSTYYRKLKGR